MKNLTIITSQEYRLNQPSIFTKIDDQYVGCLIYPHSRNYPELSYWESAESSDSGRNFAIEQKEFSDDEIIEIKKLQNLINSLAVLIPNQPKFTEVYANFNIKRGKAYEDYKILKEKRELEIKNHFSSIEIYDKAKIKAFADLRKILNK